MKNSLLRDKGGRLTGDVILIGCGSIKNGSASEQGPGASVYCL
jgi:hypothetical protein